MAVGVGGREVREVGDDEVDRPGHRIEQVAMTDSDAVAEAVPPDVRAGK